MLRDLELDGNELKCVIECVYVCLFVWVQNRPEVKTDLHVSVLAFEVQDLDVCASVRRSTANPQAQMLSIMRRSDTFRTQSQQSCLIV